MLHIHCWNGYFNDGGTKEDSILNVIKLENTYIPIKVRIIYPYVDGFFDYPCKVLALPAYYIEVVLAELMSC